jgi:hypothetical protein
MPVELAVELTAEWCDLQNKEVGLSRKVHVPYVWRKEP